MNGRPVENAIKTEAEATIKTHKKFFIQKLEKLERNEFESRKELMRSEMEERIPLTWEMVPAAAGEEAEQLLKKKRRSQTESAPSHNTPSISSESGSGHPSQPPNFNIGRWTEQEHKKFLEAILMFGNEWKKVQKYISTRSSTQARSHAQKFFLRLKKNIKFNEEFSDSTLNLGSRSTLRPIQSGYAHEIKKSAENLGHNPNHRYDSILKFLTDYSKTSEEEENCAMPDAHSMTNDQRRKLINIVLNFTRQSSHTRNRPESKPERKDNFLYEDEEADWTSQNDFTEDEKEDSDTNRTQFGFYAKNKISSDKQIFRIHKVKKIGDNKSSHAIASNLFENGTFYNSSNPHTLNKFTNSFSSSLPQQTYSNNFYSSFSPSTNYNNNPPHSPNNQIENFNNYSYPYDPQTSLGFLLNSEMNLRDVINENKILEEKKLNDNYNNSLNSSTCSYSPHNLQMNKSNFIEKSCDRPCERPSKKDKDCNLKVSQQIGITKHLNNNCNALSFNEQLLINNSKRNNNLYDDLKTFFNSTRKNSEIRSVVSFREGSRKNSVRETDLIHVLVSKNDEIFSDKNFVEKQNLEEDFVKNPFSLNFDTENDYHMPGGKSKVDTNPNLCYEESIKVEYENINIIY